MEKPIIELKSIKMHVGLSQETPAYTAKLYVDGEYFCHVANSGHGGPDDRYRKMDENPHGLLAELKELDERLYGFHPEHSFKGKDGTMHHMALEVLCHTAAWDHVEERNLRSKLSKKVMFTAKAQTELMHYKAKKSEQLMKYAREHLEKGEAILNDLPFEEAFVLYKKITQPERPDVPAMPTQDAEDVTDDDANDVLATMLSGVELTDNFDVRPGPDGTSVLIVDTHTGREVKVDLFAYRQVANVLNTLFG